MNNAVKKQSTPNLLDHYSPTRESLLWRFHMRQLTLPTLKIDINIFIVIRYIAIWNPHLSNYEERRDQIIN